MDYSHPTMGDIAWDAAQTNRDELKNLKDRMATLEKQLERITAILATPTPRGQQ